MPKFFWRSQEFWVLFGGTKKLTSKQEKLIRNIDNERTKAFTTPWALEGFYKKYRREYSEQQLSHLKQNLHCLKNIHSLSLLQLSIPLLIAFLVSVVLFPVPGKILLSMNPLLWGAESQCSQNLVEVPQENITNLIESCQKIVNDSNNKFFLNKAHKNIGRAILVRWDGRTGDYRETSKQSEITEARKHFESALAAKPQDAQAAAYLGLMSDFEDFVLEQTFKCLPASERYERALRLYKNVEKIKKTDGNFFMVLELGHFLTSRDRHEIYLIGDAYWDNLNGFKKAIQLYNKLNISKKKYSAEYSQVILSKANAQLLNREYSKARESFEEMPQPFRTYQVEYYIGNSYALEGISYALRGEQRRASERYRKSLEYYKRITENEDTGRYYYALRDSAFAHYLRGDYAGAKVLFERALKLLKNDPERESKNRILMEEYFSKINNSQCDVMPSNVNNPCYQDSVVDDLYARGEGIFWSVFTVHMKDAATDPFLAVEHDAFYKCREEPEFS